MRITGTSLDCYKYLEPLLNDFRKIKFQSRDGSKLYYANTGCLLQITTYPNYLSLLVIFFLIIYCLVVLFSVYF